MAKNSISFYPILHEQESITQCCQNHNVNTFQFNDSPSWSPKENGAVASSSHSHRQAEKRRRDRINGQLTRLRKLVPMSDKMDKAAVLERVIDQIKNLNKDATEISKFQTIPTATDEINIESHTTNQQDFTTPNDKEKKNVAFIKATFCCDDRSDLIPDLIRGLKGLDLTTVAADIACLSGRIKCILILLYKSDKGSVASVTDIKQSLKTVLTRLVSWSASTSNFRVTSKRQRFFFPS